MTWRATNLRPGGRLLGAVLLLAAATACTPDGPTAPTSPGVDLEQLRRRAALPACPSGLSPELPSLTLPCLSGGQAVDISAQVPARPVLVNVWATWCAPCVREFPHLVDAAQRSGGSFDVVGVLTQDTASNGLEFARQFEMNYTSVIDDNGVVMRRFSPGPPVTLFVSADGTIKHVQRGELRSRAQLDQLLRQHLDVQLRERDPTAASTALPPYSDRSTGAQTR